MRTPSHAPSARLSRAAGPMPPRSRARRVLRPLPRPRKRRGEAMAERHSAIDTTTPPFEGRPGSAGAPRALGGLEERPGFAGALRTLGGLEERPGFAGALRTLGGLEERPGFAGALRTLGGLEERPGFAGALRTLEGLEERPALPGRSERWRVWGAMSGPPISIDTMGPPCENGPNSPIFRRRRTPTDDAD